MKKSDNTLILVASVLVVAAGIYIILNGVSKSGKEGFQSVLDVKKARQMAYQQAKEGFASTRVGKKKEGFQTASTNVAAAVPIPVSAQMPPNPAGATPTIALQPGAQMPALTMNALSNAVASAKLPTPSTPIQMASMSNAMAPASVVGTPSGSNAVVQKFTNMNENQGSEYRKGMKEGFQTGNYGTTGGGAKDSYEPIGAFDNVLLPTGNNVSSWRYTAPDESLLGAPFQVGQDNLFMFKNNQCKPECCGASFSCSGGCVCTTPEQRQYIASRGGNRTKPQDD